MQIRKMTERLVCMSQGAKFALKMYVRSVGEQLSKSESAKAYICECEPQGSVEIVWFTIRVSVP